MAWDITHRPAAAAPLATLPRVRKFLPGLAIDPKSPPMPDLSIMEADNQQIAGMLSPVLEDSSQLPLVVDVSVRFYDSIVRSKYSRTYGSSPNFKPNNSICNGLLRRIEHCAEELITRKDSTAFRNYRDEDGAPKELRFELKFRMIRRETGEWAERSFASYQKQPLTVQGAKEIILSTHRIVGLFLRRHDKEFKWLDGSIREPTHTREELVSPSLNGPMSPLCVPPAVFDESSQSFAASPGYHIEVSLSSRNSARRNRDFQKVVRISSRQTAPLTLFASEDILWKGLDAIQQGLDPRKRDFEEHLKHCTKFGCQHYDEDAVDIEIRVVNNLTPSFDHLRRRVKSKLALFREPQGQDCLGFLDVVEARLEDARNQADAKINEMNDFEFRLLELRGMGWSVNNPAVFTLDSETSYSRRTIEAALERIQTGIGDVLRGHDVAVHFNAYKRGHLVTDKALVARRKGKQPKEFFKSVEREKDAFITRLKLRIQHDLDTVCKDTCSVDDLQEDDSCPPREADGPSILPQSQEEQHDARSTDPVMLHPNHTLSLSITPPPEAKTAERPSSNEFDIQNLIPAAAIAKTEAVRERTKQLTVKVSQAPKSPTILMADGRVQRVFPLSPRSYSPPARLSSDSTLLSEPSLLDPIEPEVQVVEEEERREASLEETEEDNDTKEFKDIESYEEAVLPLEQHPGVLKEAGEVEKVTEQDVAASITDKVIETPDTANNMQVASEASVDVQSTTATELGLEEALVNNESTGDVTIVPQEPVAYISRAVDAAEPAELSTSIEVCAPDTRNLGSEQPVSPIDEFSRSRVDMTDSLLDAEEPDAEEPNSDMDLGHMTKCETRESVESSSQDKELASTAPSTPGLSSSAGDSSPRYSMLTTPIYLRTMSGRKDPITPETEACYEPDIPGSYSETTIEVGPADASKDTRKGKGLELDGSSGLYHYPELLPLPEGLRNGLEEQDRSIPEELEADLSESSCSDAEPGSPTLQLLRAANSSGARREDAEATESLVELGVKLDETNSLQHSGETDDPVEFSGPTSNPPCEDTPATPIAEAAEDCATSPAESPEAGESSEAREPELSISSSSGDSLEPTPLAKQKLDDHLTPFELVGEDASARHPKSLHQLIGGPVGSSAGPDFAFLELTSNKLTLQHDEKTPEIKLEEFRPLASLHIGSADLRTVSEMAKTDPTERKKGINPLFTKAELERRERIRLTPRQSLSIRGSTSSLSLLSRTDTIKSNNGRDSVETVIVYKDEDKGPDPHHEYRPQTAGYLGLHETRLVEVGLRGALGGARRYSLPLEHMAGAGGSEAGRPASKSSKSARASRAKKEKKRRAKSTGALTSEAHNGEEEGGDRLLPKFMMIFAGMAVASKLFNKP